MNAMDNTDNPFGSVYTKFIEDITPIEMSYIIEGVIQAEESDGSIELNVPRRMNAHIEVSIPGEIPFTISSPFTEWGLSHKAEWLIVRSFPLKVADLKKKGSEFCVNEVNAMFPMSKIYIAKHNDEEHVAIQSSVALTGGISRENLEARIFAHRRASLLLRAHCNGIRHEYAH